MLSSECGFFANGILCLDGTAVTLEQEIASAELVNLSFHPDTDWNGSTSFTYSVSDGDLWSEASATVTMTVTAVNDAPVLEEAG